MTLTMCIQFLHIFFYVCIRLSDEWDILFLIIFHELSHVKNVAVSERKRELCVYCVVFSPTKIPQWKVFFFASFAFIPRLEFTFAVWCSGIKYFRLMWFHFRADVHEKIFHEKFLQNYMYFIYMWTLLLLWCLLHISGIYC